MTSTSIDYGYKHFLLLVAIAAFFWNGCLQDRNKHQRQERNYRMLHDTTIVTKRITNELAGSAYRNSAVQYALVVNRDTCALQFIVARARHSGQISFDIRFQQDLSYSHQYRVMKKLMSYAFRDFPVQVDSVHLIFISRLVTTGDLAVHVSNQYKDAVGFELPLSLKRVSDHLMKSKLTEDWNVLLQPYGVEVQTVSAEKIFFIEGSEIYRYSRIETAKEMIPEKILDCMVWLRLKRIRPQAVSLLQ